MHSPASCDLCTVESSDIAAITFCSSSLHTRPSKGESPHVTMFLFRLRLSTLGRSQATKPKLQDDGPMQSNETTECPFGQTCVHLSCPRGYPASALPSSSRARHLARFKNFCWQHQYQVTSELAIHRRYRTRILTYPLITAISPATTS